MLKKSIGRPGVNKEKAVSRGVVQSSLRKQVVADSTKSDLDAVVDGDQRMIVSSAKANEQVSALLQDLHLELRLLNEEIARHAW